MENWKGKHILVVGASEGIGKETALECARRGARLSLVARSEKVKEIIPILEGEEQEGFCFDVSEIKKIDGFVSELVKTRGALDGLVYCVGPQCVRPLKMLKPETVNETMTVGFSAYIEFVRTATKKGNYKKPMSSRMVTGARLARAMRMVTMDIWPLESWEIFFLGLRPNSSSSFCAYSLSQPG